MNHKLVSNGRVAHDHPDRELHLGHSKNAMQLHIYGVNNSQPAHLRSAYLKIRVSDQRLRKLLLRNIRMMSNPLTNYGVMTIPNELRASMGAEHYMFLCLLRNKQRLDEAIKNIPASDMSNLNHFFRRVASCSSWFDPAKIWSRLWAQCVSDLEHSLSLPCGVITDCQGPAGRVIIEISKNKQYRVHGWHASRHASYDDVMKGLKHSKQKSYKSEFFIEKNVDIADGVIHLTTKTPIERRCESLDRYMQDVSNKPYIEIVDGAWPLGLTRWISEHRIRCPFILCDPNISSYDELFSAFLGEILPLFN